jgi:hypothetical protein
MIRLKIRHFKTYSEYLEEVVMRVNFRFPKSLIWGSIALLLFAVGGCSLPTDPVSGPSSREETSEQDSQDQGSSDQSSGEEPGDEDGEDDAPDTGDGQNEPEDEDGEDEDGENDAPDTGDGQNEPEDEDGEDDAPDGNEEDRGAEIPASGDLAIRIGTIAKSEGTYPDLSGVTRYRLDFFAEDGKTAESLSLDPKEEITVTLDAGEWEIRAYGVMERGAGQPPLAIIGGTARVTVPEGGTESILIVPDRPAAGSGEQGFLSWKIDYPEEKIWEAVLTVSLKIDEGGFVPYRYFDLTAPGAKEQRISLPSGTYRMESRFLSHNITAGSTEVVHIFPGLETGSGHVTIAGNIFPDAAEFSSVAELKTYLDTQPENTEAAPYPLKIAGVDLSSKEKTGETMKTLYDALSRYVSLDLRGGSGLELITASASPSLAGRRKIVSMILPETITTVKSNGFSGYEALKSAVLPKVITIDYAAFNNLGSLETVAAPELTGLVDYTNSSTSSKGVFYYCTALKSIYFPKLETIGHHAFYGCSALTEVLFPKTVEVGPSVFAECTALRTAVLPNVVFIGNRAFNNDKSFENLVLGLVLSELGDSVFSSGFPQKLWVPASAIEDYQNSAFWTKMKNRIYPIAG